MESARAAGPQTLPFQAEVRELLALVVHSLYGRQEIFLRELVSNASDALDRLRHEALTRPGLGLSGDAGRIRIEIDRARRRLSVSDDGIGMSREELVSNLGTIARSGTRAFLERLREAQARDSAAGASAPSLIGQFGVGFYSCFMVAGLVEVTTRRAGEDSAHLWRSKGEGEFTIEPAERAACGTTVTLHLREKPVDEPGAEPVGEREDWLDPDAIRAVVKRWSDFVAWPIEFAGEVLNSTKPLWMRPRSEVTPDEHREFYRHLTHAFDEPLETIHFKAEGATEWTALLYVPSEQPLDLVPGPEAGSWVALYVKRVLIVPDCADLLPPWLRFVRGVVDAPDLPLNVSRESVQHDPRVRRIRERLEKRVLEALAGLLERDRERYRRFFAAFGAILKEGVWAGEDEDGRIRRIALFETSAGEAPTTLSEYVARMKPGQESIWCLAGQGRASAAASPHLELFARRGEEVLFLLDPIDEWAVARAGTFEGRRLRWIDRGDLGLETPAAKQAREDQEREHRDLLAAVEERLRGRVGQARFSTRLSERAAVLVSGEGALSPRMERALRGMGQRVPESTRALELNPDHALVKRLQAAFARDPRSAEFGDLAELLHGQALLAEGSPLEDGARFAGLLDRLLGGLP